MGWGCDTEPDKVTLYTSSDKIDASSDDPCGKVDSPAYCTAPTTDADVSADSANDDVSVDSADAYKDYTGVYCPGNDCTLMPSREFPGRWSCFPKFGGADASSLDWLCQFE